MDQELRNTNEINDLMTKFITKYVLDHGLRGSDFEVDDLVQDSWLRVLDWQVANNKTLNILGKENEKNKSLIFDLCHKAIVSKIRKEKIRDAQSMEDDVEGDRVKWTNDQISDAELDIEWDEILNMFPEGSPEWIWVRYYAEKSKAMYEKDGDRSKYKGGFTDGRLASILGMGGTGNRRWKRFNQKMKDFIKDYYEFREKDDKEEN